jgi:hypothetical protein
MIREHFLQALRRVGRAALLVPCAALGVASPAQAAPRGIFAVFANCPRSIPGLELCLEGLTTGGAFTIGGTTLPISRAITMQGGTAPVGSNEYLVPPSGGEILSKAEQPIPGGLLGLVTCGAIGARVEREACSSIVARGATAVTAVTEVVSSESHPALFNALAFLLQNGEPVLTLPVRVRLNNPFLGSGCHIGSVASPILLRLTDGVTSPPPPAKPITGRLGRFEEEVENASMTVVYDDSLVDNAFSVPGAEGCGGRFSPLLDPLLDAKLGLPSRAGRNSAILNSSALRLALVEDIARSEE